MANDLSHSSDSARSARPLQHAQTFTFEGPWSLEMGGSLPEVTVAYETYGRLNARRDNAVLVCHALSGDSHVARHDEQDDPGWWDLVVGPGKPIDTDRYFVICPNVLGGCRGTTGPNSINPQTGRRYATDFPVLTVGDIVRTQARLIEHLGVERLLAVIGGSLGGHMVLDWATRFPERVTGAVAIATSARLTSQALAFDVVGRNAILSDPHYQSGQYYDHAPGPAVGLAIARMLGHITYLSREAMTEKFEPDRLAGRHIQTQFETKFSVGSYLAYQGNRFVERFDPNSYLTLSTAIDLFDLGDTQQHFVETLQPSQCRWLLISYTSDWLFPPFQSEELCARTGRLRKTGELLQRPERLRARRVPPAGRAANLRRDGARTSYLENLDGDKPESEHRNGLAGPAAGAADLPASPTSIFHGYRLDYDSILELIPPGVSVLDLGCGTGGLLARLRRTAIRESWGSTWTSGPFSTACHRGLDVVHAD